MNEAGYDSLFWITILGSPLNIRWIRFTSCSEEPMPRCRCGCFECIRDVGAEDSQDAELDVPDFTSR